MLKWKLHKDEPPKLLKDRFWFSPISLVFPRHHFLMNIFDRKLQQYIEGDLIGYSLRPWEELGDPKRYTKHKEPFAVLKLRELEAGFVVCLVPLVLSIYVFAIECMPTLKNLVIFLIIFKKFFDVKKVEQSKHCELMKIKFSKWQAVTVRVPSTTELRKDTAIRELARFVFFVLFCLRFIQKRTKKTNIYKTHTAGASFLKTVFQQIVQQCDDSEKVK